jgi:putative transposase
LTFCTIHRARLFEDAAIVSRSLDQIRITARLERFAILAYCFMPEHLHLLVEGLDQHADLRHFAKMSKQRSGAIHALSGNGRLWQEGYWEKVLRVDEDLGRVVRYVLENPVRANLARTAGDYPFTGSDIWNLADLL